MLSQSIHLKTWKEGKTHKECMSFFTCNCLPSCCILCLPACICIQPVSAASFIYFIICHYTLPVWLIVCFYVCTYLSFSFLRHGLLSITVVLDCVLPLFFLCPTSSFCSVPSSSLPVLIWKCFGLQWMMVVTEEIKWPCGPIHSLFKKPFDQPHDSLVTSAVRARDYSHSDGLHSGEQFELWNTAVR